MNFAPPNQTLTRIPTAKALTPPSIPKLGEGIRKPGESPGFLVMGSLPKWGRISDLSPVSGIL